MTVCIHAIKNLVAGSFTVCAAVILTIMQRTAHRCGSLPRSVCKRWQLWTVWNRWIKHAECSLWVMCKLTCTEWEITCTPDRLAQWFVLFFRLDRLAPINYRKEVIKGIRCVPLLDGGALFCCYREGGLNRLRAPSAGQSAPGLDSSQVGAGSHWWSWP